MACDKTAIIDRAHQTVRFPGFDYEGRAIRLHMLTAHHLVVKVSGGSTWASIGQREYVPAHFEIYDIVGGHGDTLCVEEVIDFPINIPNKPDKVDVSHRKFGPR